MLGPEKARDLDRPVLVSLEALVPQGHFYRHLEATLDLDFVRELVRDRYAAVGRPSIDPVVFFKLQLVMFFEGIRSERKPIGTASLNLAHRWYLGYAPDEPLPDHSSLTRIRTRVGLHTFRPDRPNAEGGGAGAAGNGGGGVPRRWDLLEECRLDPARPPSCSYRRVSDQVVSRTDSDATSMNAGGRVTLGYQDHYVVDGGRHRVILQALAMPADVMENQPMLDLLWRVRFRWKLRLGLLRFRRHLSAV